LWAHYALHAYSKWRNLESHEIQMTFLETRAAMVTFIRPHPVVLASVVDGARGNIFPMNILGDLGDGRMGLALRKSRTASGLVERARRIALSTVPLAKAHSAYRLAANHLKESIDWGQLPFSTRPSCVFGIPVPEFALRVREVEIEKIQPIGSHTFFVGRIKKEERVATDIALHVVHGFYQAYRLRGRGDELRNAVAQDSVHKRGSLG
jgi:flavin reductase (DIM6/NTAB) family NADH-FMN oxidoreductase RutF